jgi:hypothetical protein
MAPKNEDAAPAPDMTAVMMALIEKLGDKLSEAQFSPAMLKEIMMESQKAAAEATHKAMRPENAVHPHISVYSYPEGDIERPKPKLTRDTFFCGIREEEDRLTPSEILAFNAITQPIDARGGEWRALIKKAKHMNAKDELHIFVPIASVDQRMVLPHQLVLLLHELNGGPSTGDLSELLQQIENLKKALASKGSSPAEIQQAVTGKATDLEEQFLNG